MSAGGPGSRSKTIMVGQVMSFARASDGCSSIAARLASHYQRRQVVGQNVMHRAMVSLAPDRSSLHPVGTMLGRILLVKKFFVNAIGITLARKRRPARCGASPAAILHVVVDDLLLGKSRRRIKNFLQVRQLELLV